MAVDKKWFNLFVLILALVIIAGVFLLMPELQQNTFEKQYDEMSSVWKDAGFNRVLFHSSPGALEDLSEGKLLEIKSGLSSYNSSCSNDALKSLSSAYISLTDYIISKKEVDSSTSAIPESPENKCDYLGEYSNFLNASEENFSRYNEYVSLINSFISSYPEEAEYLELSQIEGGGIQQSDIDSLREGFNSIEGKC